MSKIEKYQKENYVSIGRALYELMLPHCTNADVSVPTVFTKEALEEALAFLCFNNIQHNYTAQPLKNYKGISNILTLQWVESSGAEKSICWFEKE